MLRRAHSLSYTKVTTKESVDKNMTVFQKRKAQSVVPTIETPFEYPICGTQHQPGI